MLVGETGILVGRRPLRNHGESAHLSQIRRARNTKRGWRTRSIRRLVTAYPEEAPRHLHRRCGRRGRRRLWGGCRLTVARVGGVRGKTTTSWACRGEEETPGRALDNSPIQNSRPRGPSPPIYGLPSLFTPRACASDSPLQSNSNRRFTKKTPAALGKNLARSNRSLNFQKNQICI
jgi:hypothetical protein